MTHNCGIKILLKNRGLYDWIQNLCETADKPLNLQKVCQQYKKENNYLASSQNLENQVRKYRKCILRCSKLSPVTKVKQLFALSEPITDEFYAKLLIHSHITVDSKKRITEFDDGINYLKGSHSSTQKHRQTVMRKTSSAEREEQQQLDDAQLMIANPNDQFMNPIKDDPTSSVAAAGNMARRQPPHDLFPNGVVQSMIPTQGQPVTSATAAGNMARRQTQHYLVPHGVVQSMIPTQGQPVTSATAAGNMARRQPPHDLFPNGVVRSMIPTQGQPATSTTAAGNMARRQPPHYLVPHGVVQSMNPTQGQPATSMTAAGNMTRRQLPYDLFPNGGGRIMNPTQGQPATSTAAGNMTRTTIPFAKHEKLLADIQELVNMDFGTNDLSSPFRSVHRRMESGIASLQDFQSSKVERTRELKMDDLFIGLKSFVLVLRKESRINCNEESRGFRDFILNFRFILFKLKLPELNEFVSQLKELANVLSPQQKVSLEKFEFALTNFVSIIAPCIDHSSAGN